MSSPNRVLKSEGKVFGNISKDVFEKHIIEEKHLLWREGGVPAIDKATWDKNKAGIKIIRIKTDKGREWVIPAAIFEEKKKVINLGFGEQYVVKKENWNIVDSKNPGLF